MRAGEGAQQDRMDARQDRMGARQERLGARQERMGAQPERMDAQKDTQLPSQVNKSNKLPGKISPSMMCCGIDRLAVALEAFAAAGVEYLHVDVIDGAFAPNYTLGTDYIKQLRRLAAIPLDVHLMIERPEDKIGWFEPQPGEYVSIHYESTPHVQRALRRVRDSGAKPMIALNPATHIRAIEYLLEDVDAVLIMTVNPGFAGQSLIGTTLPKIADLRRWLDAEGYGKIEIEVDGNVSFTNAARMREAGADIFVAGSSSVFAADMDIAGGVARLRAAIA